MDDGEKQKLELRHLQEMYSPEELEIIISPACVAGRFSAYLQLPRPFFVLAGYADPFTGRMRTQSYNLDELPPIQLFFQLPADYPSQSMPNYQIYCPWLDYNQMRTLTRAMNRFWLNSPRKKNVIYGWTQLLRESALSILGITGILDLTDFDLMAPSVADVKTEVRRVNKGYGRHRILQTELSKSINELLLIYNRQRHLYQHAEPEKKCDVCLQVDMALARGNSAVPESQKLCTMEDKVEMCPKCPSESCKIAVLPHHFEPPMAICNLCCRVFCSVCERTYHGPKCTFPIEFTDREVNNKELDLSPECNSWKDSPCTISYEDDDDDDRILIEVD